MKKNVMIVLSVFLIIIFICCGCNKNDIENNNMYHSQSYIQECKDGWILFMSYEYNLSEQGDEIDQFINIDAVNLKYNNLEDFQVLCIDEDTQKVIAKMKPEVSYLSMNPKYEGILSEIENFLIDRKLSPDLTTKELLFLEDNEIFSLEDIVKVYNTAILKGDLNFGKYGNISESGLKREKALDDYMWQVGYYVSYVNIFAVNIELIDSSGVYLSNINSNELSKNQKKIINLIDEIEKNIIQTQSFINLGIDSDTTIGDIKFNRLFNLLQNIEKENNDDKIESY